MSVKPMFKKITHGEKSSLDVNRVDIHGLGLNVGDYTIGPGAHSSLSDGVGSTARHYRSASTETTASGKKFLHPFAQSPRPYTPPVGQANSMRENEFARDSFISEDDLFPPRSQSNLSSHRPQVNHNIAGPPPLRIKTSRRAFATHGGSQSNLHSPLALHSSDHLNAMSPSSVRSSFERAIPRIRSRSDISSISQHDAVRQARRQFQEHEAAKDRKIALDEIRAMEKQFAREEKKHGRKSATISEEGRAKRSRSDVTQNEKIPGLVGTDYNNTSYRAPPVHADSSGSESHYRRRANPPQPQSTKKRTHSLWTEFVLWLRTRLFKLGRRASRA